MQFRLEKGLQVSNPGATLAKATGFYFSNEYPSRTPIHFSQESCRSLTNQTLSARIMQASYISDKTCQILADQTFPADSDDPCKFLASPYISCKTTCQYAALVNQSRLIEKREKLISPLPRGGHQISSSTFLSGRPFGHYLPIASYGTIFAAKWSSNGRLEAVVLK